MLSLYKSLNKSKLMKYNKTNNTLKILIWNFRIKNQKKYKKIFKFNKFFYFQKQKKLMLNKYT